MMTPQKAFMMQFVESLLAQIKDCAQGNMDPNSRAIEWDDDDLRKLIERVIPHPPMITWEGTVNNEFEGQVLLMNRSGGQEVVGSLIQFCRQLETGVAIRITVEGLKDVGQFD